MAHRFSLKLLTALALAGCCELTPDQDTPAEADLACEPDELALAWTSNHREFAGNFHPATLAVAPGGALFISSGEVSRMVDGTPVALLTDSAVLDDEWTRGIDVDRETRSTSSARARMWP